MEYRITKDCGVGWDAAISPVRSAWGVAESQKQKADRAKVGDIFLHYIDSARAWAGYSKVIGPLQANTRDNDADWVSALPYVIPIERVVWLSEGQAEQASLRCNVPGKSYHRQASFTRISADVGDAVIAAISVAANTPSSPSPDFHARWMKKAERYYKSILRSSARGACQLCRESLHSWVDRIKVAMTTDEQQRFGEGFLDAAHIKADCDAGSMTPDNLRALCPNCHRVVDRLSFERREAILRHLGSVSY